MVLVSRNGGKLTSALPYHSVPTPTTIKQEADGGHHLEGGGGPFEDPREELESESLDGREDEEAQCRGIRPWHPVLAVQEVEDEDGQRGNGPVGEIEDPRRLVREHQTRRRPSRRRLR